jgi:expansin (peptidoglycan-binding protein)
MIDDRAYNSYKKEIVKDNVEINQHKKNYADLVKTTLGSEINNFNSYIKKEPSKWVKIKNYISKVFKHI